MTNNPILPGFNPDPSICRAGDDFYIATSSFQWWPGVPIYHSRDLRHWALVSYALTDPAHLDLRRIGDSAGIWAPCLSYADGLFWLIFTVASGGRQHTYECPNYLTTAADVRGPWSTPIYLNTTGNDPSLFHDDDGRKWLVNTEFVWAPGYRAHNGTAAAGVFRRRTAADRPVPQHLRRHRARHAGRLETAQACRLVLSRHC